MNFRGKEILQKGGGTMAKVTIPNLSSKPENVCAKRDINNYIETTGAFQAEWSSE